ncbi:hypothetical protein BDV27DRAFT_50744 [Aspergillus caelatus]|uniref:Uncharacterized protein n=1 Tax=Aspergillus caelatus TaxID=61420 RepID=A0A5N6ZQQ7_9EURO|nr:uncharacterized protein BDV27DRAFT_50744 [Aspergillus caelatus]KAE8359718.1 hypothetical protein BDV27DRAFT_50744 [Aspergillus caelatus]
MLCLELWDPLSRPLSVSCTCGPKPHTHSLLFFPPPGCSTLPCRILNSLEGLLIRSITSPCPPSRLPRFLLFENHSTSPYLLFFLTFSLLPGVVIIILLCVCVCVRVLGVLTVLPFCLYLHIRLSPKNSLHVTSISRLRHTTNQSFHSITDLTLRSLRSLARSPSPHLPWSYFNSSVPHPSRRCLRTPRIGFFRYTSRPHGFSLTPAGSYWQAPAPAEST